MELCKTLLAGYKCPRIVDIIPTSLPLFRCWQDPEARVTPTVLGTSDAARQLGFGRARGHAVAKCRLPSSPRCLMTQQERMLSRATSLVMSASQKARPRRPGCFANMMSAAGNGKIEQGDRFACSKGNAEAEFASCSQHSCEAKNKQFARSRLKASSV